MSRLLAFLTLLAVAGCTQDPPVAEATGKVVRGGAPAVSGKVLFLPLGGGNQAIGAIQPDGSFRLGTFGDDDGALVGRHHAVLVKVEFGDAPDDDASFQAVDGEELEVFANQANEFTLDVGTASWQPLPE